MGQDLLTKYDELKERLRAAEDQTAVAKGHYDSALAKQKKVEKELDAVRTAISRAISVADEPPVPAKRPDTKTKPREDSAPGVRPSFMAVIRAIPRDGDAGMDDLRKALPDLLDGALNTRLAKMKKAGLVESGGWGRYQLTEVGKKLHGQRLHVVANGS